MLAALDSTATHLVGDVVGSPYHRDWSRQGKHLVRSQWIVDSFEQGRLLESDHYKPAPLAGLSICLTGFEKDRDELKNALEKLGATFNGTLHMGCSHLVCARPEGKALPAHTAGPKYQGALQYRSKPGWQELKIVSRAWLDEVVRTQLYVEEEPYDLTPAPSPPPSKIPMGNVSIFLSNLSETMMKAARSAIRRLGAVHVTEMSSLVTHVVTEAATVYDPSPLTLLAEIRSSSRAIQRPSVCAVSGCSTAKNKMPW